MRNYLLPNLFGAVCGILCFLSISAYRLAADKTRNTGNDISLSEGDHLKALEARRFYSLAKISASKALDREATVGLAYKVNSICKFAEAMARHSIEERMLGKEINAIANISTKNEFTILSTSFEFEKILKNCQIYQYPNHAYFITSSNNLRTSLKEVGILNDYSVIIHSANIGKD